MSKSFLRKLLMLPTIAQALIFFVFLCSLISSDVNEQSLDWEGEQSTEQETVGIVHIPSDPLEAIFALIIGSGVAVLSTQFLPQGVVLITKDWLQYQEGFLNRNRWLYYSKEEIDRQASAQAQKAAEEQEVREQRYQDIRQSANGKITDMLSFKDSLSDREDNQNGMQSK